VKRKVNVFKIVSGTNLVILILRVLLGVTGTLLLYYSFKYASIGEVILVYNINPLIVILLGACILCEPLKLIDLILVLGAFAGVFMISHVNSV